MYRYERKYLLNRYQYEMIKSHIKAIFKKDMHQTQDGYHVSTLYFDNHMFESYNEKAIGIHTRSKYRIRSYGDKDKSNHQPSTTEKEIKLEIKQKKDEYVHKEIIPITENLFQAIINKEYRSLLQGNTPEFSNIMNRWFIKLQSGYQPKVIVDYDREAYIHKTNQIRLTFDHNLSYCTNTNTFLTNQGVFYPLGDRTTVILEVKYYDNIPEFLINVLSQFNIVQTTVSKYCLTLEELENKLLWRVK